MSRENLPDYMKGLSIKSLSRLLAAHYGDDPQNELDDETIEAIEDQIDYLNGCLESKYDQERDR